MFTSNMRENTELKPLYHRFSMNYNKIKKKFVINH